MWDAEGASFRPSLCTAHSHPRETRSMPPVQRKFAICKPLGLLSIRNDTSSALGLVCTSLSRLSRPVPQHSVRSASYKPTEQPRREFTREISPATTRCGNAREIRVTSAALSETRSAHRVQERKLRYSERKDIRISSAAYTPVTIYRRYYAISSYSAQFRILFFI